MEGYRYDSEGHVHLLDGKPLIGTSSMASVLAKPGLTWWSAGLACEKLGWTHPGNAKDGWKKKEDRLREAEETQDYIHQLNPEEYLKLLDEAYRAHTTKLHSSAATGIDMHSVMEKYVKACIEKNGGVPIKGKTENPKLSLFVDWATKNVKRFLWSEINCYSRELWLGGISDCGYEDKDGLVAILDFKSSKEAYLSQFWQCVGYAIQIEENGGFTPEGNRVIDPIQISYVAVLPFGMEKPEVQYSHDMTGGREAVKAMLLLHRKLS